MPKWILHDWFAMIVGGVFFFMARPKKENADYFPHEAHMRNDSRILALRRKFGLTGYAVYVMTVEALTNANNFELDISLMNREILAGDFGIESSELDTIWRYCVQIDLFQQVNELLMCASLNKRLESLINRRVSADINNTETSHKQYSKVKESKEKNSKEEESKVNETALVKDFQWYLNQFDEIYVENLKMTHKGKDFMQAAKESYAHMAADSVRLKNADSSDCKKLLNTWLTNQKNNGKQINTPESRASKLDEYFASKYNQ